MPMNANEYLLNPCEASSLPFWKTETVTIPNGMLIVRDDDFCQECYSTYDDTPYFKRIHHLRDIPRPCLPDGFTWSPAPDCEVFGRHIMECYGAGEAIIQQIDSYRTHSVYDADLWICIQETASRRIAATGIAEYDPRIREGILEWIQVSAPFRRIGLGSSLVCALLERLKTKAAFVTVSGQTDSPFLPLVLYESCGFTGTALWHVLQKPGAAN